MGEKMKQVCYICGHILNVEISRSGYYTNKVDLIGEHNGVIYWRCAICKKAGYIPNSFEIGKNFDFANTLANP